VSKIETLIGQLKSLGPQDFADLVAQLRQVRVAEAPTLTLEERQARWKQLAGSLTVSEGDLCSGHGSDRATDCVFLLEIRRNLEIQNAIIPENDLWIAASAKEHDLPLLTSDDHFKRVAGIPVLDPIQFEVDPRLL